MIDRVIAKLSAARLLDDERFAAAFVHDAQLRKPTGARLLRIQLGKKGISRPIIDGVLGETSNSETESTAALKAARATLRKYRSSRKSSDAATQQKRLAQYLSRRGFGWDVIGPVLRSLFRSAIELPNEEEDGVSRF